MTCKVTCFLLLLLFTISCNQPIRDLKFPSSWYFISNDSVYNEVYFTKDSTYITRSFNGPHQGFYKVKYDKYVMQFPEMSYNISFNDDNSIIVKNKTEHYLLKSLDISDTIGSLNFEQSFLLRASYIMVVNQLWTPQMAYDTLAYWNENNY